MPTAENYTLDREQKEFLKSETFFGNEIVPATYKTALMNLYLHNIGDIYGTVPVTLGRCPFDRPGYRVDYVLTNPPFGKSPTLTFTNEGGRAGGKKTSFITAKISGQPVPTNS